MAPSSSFALIQVVWQILFVQVVQTDDDLRPINPPLVNEVDVLWSPFDDIVPRSTKADREEADIAKRQALLYPYSHEQS